MRPLHLIAIVLAVLLLVGLPSVDTRLVITGLVAILVVWMASHLWMMRKSKK